MQLYSRYSLCCICELHGGNDALVDGVVEQHLATVFLLNPNKYAVSIIAPFTPVCWL